MNVFILSQLCRPTVHGLSCLENEQWILYEGIHTQLQNANATSMDCRLTVHGLSANSPWTFCRHQIQPRDCSTAKAVAGRPTVGRQSMDCRPTPNAVHGLSRDSPWTLSVDSPWTLSLSAYLNRPLYDWL